MYYQIIREQKLKCNIDDLWDFVTSPANLESITPVDMGFKIISDNFLQKIYPGMIIIYKVSPLFSIKLNWITEITHVKKNQFFVDEQRLGPYKLWHHQHIFEDKGDYVIMKDIVTYIPPFGIIGKFFNFLLIERKLKSIFDYRFNVMNQKFNK